MPCAPFFREFKDLEATLISARDRIESSTRIEQIVEIVGSTRQAMADSCIEVFKNTFSKLPDSSEPSQAEMDRLISIAQVSDNFESAVQMIDVDLSDEDRAAMERQDLANDAISIRQLGLQVPPEFEGLVEEAPEPTAEQVVGEMFNSVFIAISDVKPPFEHFVEDWKPAPPHISGAIMDFRVDDCALVPPEHNIPITRIQPPLGM